MSKLELGSETYTFEFLAHDLLGNCEDNNLVEVAWAIASDIVRCTPWTRWQWFCSLTIKWKFFLYYSFAIHNCVRTKLCHRTRFIVVAVLGSTLFSVHHCDQSILLFAIPSRTMWGLGFWPVSLIGLFQLETSSQKEKVGTSVRESHILIPSSWSPWELWWQKSSRSSLGNCIQHRSVVGSWRWVCRLFACKLVFLNISSWSF